MSQNPTLSAAAKKVAKATGAKHTVCLRAVEAAAVWTTEPQARIELARQMVTAAAPSQSPTPDQIAERVIRRRETPPSGGVMPGTAVEADANAHSGPFRVEDWWAGGRSLGIYGHAKTGKSVPMDYIAATLARHRIPALVAAGYPSGESRPVPSATELLDLGGPDKDHQVAQTLQMMHEAGEEAAVFVEDLTSLQHDHPQVAEVLIRLILRRSTVRVVGTSQHANQDVRLIAAMRQAGDTALLGPADVQLRNAVGVGPGLRLPAGPYRGFYQGFSRRHHGLEGFAHFFGPAPTGERQRPTAAAYIGLPAFDLQSWHTAGTNLGIYGGAQAGKTTLAQHLARAARDAGILTCAITSGDSAPDALWTEIVDDAADLESAKRLLFYLVGLSLRGTRAVVFVDVEAELDRHTAGQLVTLALSESVQVVRTACDARPKSDPLAAAMLGRGESILMGPASPGLKNHCGLPHDTEMPIARYTGIHIAAGQQSLVMPAPMPR